MISQVSANLNNYNQKRIVQNINPSFGSVVATKHDDKFEKNKTINPILIATSTAGAAGLLLTRAKLGSMLKSVGKEVPFSLYKRLSSAAELVSKDGMTGLYNKSALLASVEKEYKTAIKDGKNFSVAMFDMDNFKSINEIFDHNTGDIILKRIATNIKQVSEKNSAKGFRYGGEEFVVTLFDQDSNDIKKIATEISDSIKKDEIIQNYLGEFKKRTTEEIKFATTQIPKFSKIFPVLRKEKRTGNQQEFAQSIIKIIQTHIKKYNPADKTALNEAIQLLKTTPASKLSSVLSVDTKIGANSTLGNELNKIYFQYNNTKNDAQKWINHINEHKMFTISGGFVNLKGIDTIKNSETPIKIADAALKSAKENGKNTIIEATDNIIHQTIKRVEK